MSTKVCPQVFQRPASRRSETPGRTPILPPLHASIPFFSPPKTLPLPLEPKISSASAVSISHHQPPAADQDNSPTNTGNPCRLHLLRKTSAFYPHFFASF